jgi:hypothetical protein
MNVVPIPVKMRPYTIEDEPPLRRDSCMLAAAPVQELSKTKEKFIVVTRLIYLLMMQDELMSMVITDGSNILRVPHAVALLFCAVHLQSAQHRRHPS